MLIKKSIFTFLVFFGAYSLAVHFRPEFSVSQHQWQDNFIKGQNYILDTSPSQDNVIVGSSLSARLNMNLIPKTYNLSFGGQSLFDGLRIIKKSGKTPKRVFIEANNLTVLENTDFIDSLFSLVPFRLAKHFAALRAGVQPLSVFINYIERFKKRIKPIIRGITNRDLPPETSVQPKPQNNILDTMLTLQVGYYSKTPDESLLEKQINLLNEYVKYFAEKGTKVFIFEMPINPKLSNLPGAKIVRNKIKARLDSNLVHFIDNDTDLYTTSDGVHLGEDEAKRYSIYLNSKISSF